MFEAHVLGYTGPFWVWFGRVLEFRGLFRVLGFAIPVSGAARKHFRIFGPVSCSGFRFAIFSVWFQRPFVGVLSFHSLFRVLCRGLRFRLRFYV